MQNCPSISFAHGGSLRHLELCHFQNQNQQLHLDSLVRPPVLTHPSPRTFYKAKEPEQRTRVSQETLVFSFLIAKSKGDAIGLRRGVAVI
jgi:hypothetical protein